MTCWVLAREVGRDPETNEPIYEYFKGSQGDHGGASRSPFRADGYKFSTAAAARECANTHHDLADSPDWRILPIRESRPPRPKIVKLVRRR